MPQSIDAGTLAATARALNAGCQPVNFARWESSGIDATPEGSDTRDHKYSAPSHNEAGQNGRGHEQERHRHRPKVCNRCLGSHVLPGSPNRPPSRTDTSLFLSSHGNTGRASRRFVYTLLNTVLCMYRW